VHKREETGSQIKTFWDKEAGKVGFGKISWGKIAKKVKSYPSFAKASVFAKATPDRMEDKKVKGNS